MEPWQQQACDALTGMGYRLDQGIVAGGRALAAAAAPELRIETKDTDLFIYGAPTPKARVWLADNGAVLIEKESNRYGDDFDSYNYHVGDLDLIFLFTVGSSDMLFQQFDLGICCVGWLPATGSVLVHPRAMQDYKRHQITVWSPITDNRVARAKKYAAKLGWPIVWQGGIDPRTFGAVAEDDCDPFF